MSEKWILASASPRRQKLCIQLGLDFEVDPASGEELCDETDPEKCVEMLARAKAKEVSDRHPGRAVLAADTLVVLSQQALGKPKDEAEACRMLAALQGRTHKVYTGVAVYLPETDGPVITGNGKRIHTFHEETTVTFAPMSREEIAAYVATGEPMDKAGAYGIQGRGGVYIERLEGDYYNVVGLPLCRLRRELTNLLM